MDHHVLTVHLCVDAKADPAKILSAASKKIASHGVSRSTIQIESEPIYAED